jgi:2'-5' RNA ligase
LNPIPETLRLFIALEIANSIKERIRILQQELMRCSADVGWVKPGNIHLTLKFLGDVTVTRLPAIRQACAEAACKANPFELELTGTGVFPNRHKPRVLWIGLGNLPDNLKGLHACLELELAEEGFPKEDRPFSPHLTIGRFRSPRNASALADLLAAVEFVAEKIPVREMVLMRSQLQPGGSQYTPLERFPFD